MPHAALDLVTSAFRFELETTIQAPAARVWQLILERPNEWWIQDLRCVGGGSTVTLDPRPGGHLAETNAEGEGLLWFSVVSIVPGRSINLVGPMAPPFGGPAQTYLFIQVEDGGDSTVVRMTQSMHGHIDPDMATHLESGWRSLLETGLKPLAESNEQ